MESAKAEAGPVLFVFKTRAQTEVLEHLRLKPPLSDRQLGLQALLVWQILPGAGSSGRRCLSGQNRRSQAAAGAIAGCRSLCTQSQQTVVSPKA